MKRAPVPRRGEPAVVRFAVPGDRDIVFEDLVRGRVSFHTSVIGDPVLVRSDGNPAYNFAVVVDDALMEVTHVVRGEDHISNTPKQLMIYEALGFTPPRFAHLALVHGARSHAALEAPRRDLGRGVPGRRDICRRHSSTTWR